MTREVGPYMNDDGDWWMPVDAWSWNDAQSEAASMARDSDGVTRYEGKADAHLCDGWAEGCESTDHQRLSYHFRTIDPFLAKHREVTR